MAIKVFYSWQSKTTKKYNMWFILRCLENAVKELKKERRELETDIRVTRDTQGFTGSPNIIFAIKEQLSESDIFVGDLTYVSYVNTSTPNGNRTFWDRLFGRNRWQKEGQVSPNVAKELGIAMGPRDFSYQRVIGVINLEFGTPDQLPFDFIQTRHPLEYRYGPKTSASEVDTGRKALTKALKDAVRDILDTEHERQKKYFAPFIVWKFWEQKIDLTLPLEITDYVVDFFQTLRRISGNDRQIVRVCGLSGVGKTRLIFECFRSLPEPDRFIQGRLLYIDENLTDAQKIVNAIEELKFAKDQKILIIDNCSIELHNKIARIMSFGECRLSAVTVSGDPDETMSLYDSGSRTDQIVLINEKCKSLVDQLLRNAFTEFSDEDRKLLVDFSSGLPFIAKLMADNPERGRYEPGTLRQEDVVRRLLGPLYANDFSKAVMHACCLFSQLGFKEELAPQLDAVALDEDLFDINLGGVNPADRSERRKQIFKETCTKLTGRQLLEIRGRAYAFRPSPLAVRLAEDWWRSCTTTKFARIIPVLQEADLIEKFCEQFKFLRHVQNAKDIVANLCNDFFSSAEVLNTEVGSRLFRSFVYVNPEACATALTKAFLSLNIEAIRGMVTGRRNLVWSLEKLCYLEETFHDAISVAAIFAVAENENYANNASGLFVQLFHIFLPGTKVSLVTRWQVIDRLYSHTSPEYQSLSLRAMASGLIADNFHRTGGAEDIVDSSAPKDFNPSPKEIYDYWKSIIQKLHGHILSDGQFQDRAVSIIKDKFFALCVFGGGPIAVPVMKDLIEKGFLDTMEARKQMQFVINSGRVYDQKILADLQTIYDTLKPRSFNDRFKIYVAAPSTWEYRSVDDQGNPQGALMTNIDQLSKDFLLQKETWGSLALVLFSGSISEGLNFGAAIFRNADRQTLEDFLDFSIRALTNIPAADRNIGVFLGTLSEKRASSHAQRIFEVVLQSEDLKYLAFAIARTTQLPFQLIRQLLSGAERGEIPVPWFIEFNYGWGIRHLSSYEIIEISERLQAINAQGKFLALYNLATWITGKEEELMAPFADVFRQMIINNATAFFEYIRNSMDVHYYSSILIYLLTSSEDPILAKAAINIIIAESIEMEHYYSKEGEFFRILRVLQDKYFSVLWEGLTKLYVNAGEYGFAAFHMKSLLGSRHDFEGQDDGLLFAGDPGKFDVILAWCKANREKEIFWIAELLPVFAGPRSTSSELHPYAKAFIDEFGDNRSVLGAIAAKMGTYGWTGSIIPKLASDKAIFTQLIDHFRPEVREWAQVHQDDVNRRIEFEKNLEAEGF